MVFPNTFLSCTASAAHSRILKSCRHLKKLFRDLVLRQPLLSMPALVDARSSAPGRLGREAELHGAGGDEGLLLPRQRGQSEETVAVAEEAVAWRALALA